MKKKFFLNLRNDTFNSKRRTVEKVEKSSQGTGENQKKKNVE